MEPPNQPGQFSAQFIYRWDNSDKLFHFVLCFRFQSEISNIFIQIVIQKMPWFCRNQPFHSLPAGRRFNPQRQRLSGLGHHGKPRAFTPEWRFSREIPAAQTDAKTARQMIRAVFLREIPLQIVLSLQDYTDQAAAALVDDPFDGLLQLDAGIAGHPTELVVQPFVDQLMQALAEDV